MKKSLYLFLNKNIGINCLIHLLAYQELYEIEIKGLFINFKSKFFDIFYQISKLYNIKFFFDINDLLSLEDVDFIISIQYDKIFRKEHLAKAKIAAINLHMAPLPKYRGCNQFSYAIINGDKEFGTTLHLMTEKVDAGDIIAQIKFPIPEFCTAELLFQLTEYHSLKLFENNIQNILNNNFKTLPQTSISSDSEYHYRNEIENLKNINLDWDKNKIISHILATTFKGYEPPYILINNKKFYIIAEDNLKG